MFVALPLSVQAAVIFNEIAWMGTTASANDEWIEIYNSGSEPINLDGWTITDNDSLNIALSGVLPSYGFFLLERTDDTSVPAVTASVIYTGGLVNSGATLTIKDDGGSVASAPLVGGADWVNIGGDNDSKYTAQLTSAGQWVTGPPTPGLPNVDEAVLPPGDETDNDNNDDKQSVDSSNRTVVKSSNGVKTTSLVLPGVTLRLALSAPINAYVHQPVHFTLEPSGAGNVIMASLKYNWNLGDLTTKTGSEVTHAYEYPGTYVVVAEAEYKRQHANVRHEITVLPVTFSLTTNSDGDLQVNNDSPYEVDLSGYKARGEKTVEFPENTIILSRGTLTIPRERLGGSYAWLVDQEQMIVASTLPMNNLVAAAENVSLPVTVAETAPMVLHASPPEFNDPPSITENTLSDTFSFRSTPAVDIPTTSVVISATSARPLTAAAINSIDNEAKPFSVNWPLVGLFGVIGLGLFSVVPSFQKHSN